MYGNRKKNGITMGQWNAGHGNLGSQIKQNEIRQIFQDLKPLILGITESYVHQNDQLEDIQIQGYDILLCNTIRNQLLKVSRVAVYVSKELIYKVRHDLMSDNFSSIWLEAGKPRQKKMLICYAYREWKFLNQQDNASESVDSQLRRWISF